MKDYDKPHTYSEIKDKIYEDPTVKLGELGYYVSLILEPGKPFYDTLYLHNDKKWRFLTTYRGGFSGYFRNREDAEKILKKSFKK
jgi:hypothetical protein